MKKRQGSITVFYSFSLLLTLVLFFCFLDVSRLVGQRNKAGILSRETTMSCFGEYLRPIWDTYGVLTIDSCYCGEGALDLSLMEAVMEEYLAENASPALRGENYYRLLTKECAIQEYGLITDQGGLPFLKEAALKQKSELPQQALEALGAQKNPMEKDSNEGKDINQMIRDGQNAIEQAREEKKATEEKNATGGKGKPPESVGKKGETKADNAKGNAGEDVTVNPLDDLMELKNRGILAQVIPADEKVSEEKLGLNEPVSKRALAAGTTGEESLSATEKILFVDYEMTHFQHYGADMQHPGLKYEWEYVINGKKSDRANLSATVEKLLLLRGAVNLGSLIKDPAKMAEVESLAMTLVGWTANPAIIEATKAGLIATWSYVESVLDVRSLLAGKKVALVKTPAEWTSQLLCLSAYFPVTVKAKECAKGIGYEEYLCTMSAMQAQKTLGLRSLDLMENALHLQEGYEQVRMDRCVYRMKVKFAYESQPIFYSILSGMRRKFPLSHFQITGTINYLTT
ncbi:MAG: DUF5702 domain-containing protein [Lachnospiraceae bacterium]|nr:DUF5702 domain-containing protein [Lachnospiraceae bacterium]